MTTTRVGGMWRRKTGGSKSIKANEQDKEQDHEKEEKQQEQEQEK